MSYIIFSLSFSMNENLTEQQKEEVRNKVVEEFAKKAFEHVGLNYKDKTNNAQNFLKEFGNPFDVILSDLDGTKSIFLGAYGVPETLILDSELKILKDTLNNKDMAYTVHGELSVNLLDQDYFDDGGFDADNTVGY